MPPFDATVEQQSGQDGDAHVVGRVREQRNQGFDRVVLRESGQRRGGRGPHRRIGIVQRGQAGRGIDVRQVAELREGGGTHRGVGMRRQRRDRAGELRRAVAGQLLERDQDLARLAVLEATDQRVAARGVEQVLVVKRQGAARAQGDLELAEVAPPHQRDHREPGQHEGQAHPRHQGGVAEQRHERDHGQARERVTDRLDHHLEERPGARLHLGRERHVQRLERRLLDGELEPVVAELHHRRDGEPGHGQEGGRGGTEHRRHRRPCPSPRPRRARMRGVSVIWNRKATMPVAA